jgi:hypothetical protein
MTIGEKDGYLTVVSERNEANSVGEDFNMTAIKHDTINMTSTRR